VVDVAMGDPRGEDDLMRPWRLLGLLPILIGLALVIIGGAHPDEIEGQVCGLARMAVEMPEACFRGARFWLAYVAAAALIVAGLGLMLWPGRPKGQARLTVKRPRLHQYPPQRPQTTNFWPRVGPQSRSRRRQ
jgi:hypothetical protein